MIHAFVEGYDLDAPWLAGELKGILRPGSRVTVVALSYRDAQVKSAQDWEALYGREGGRYTGALVGPLAAYGIGADRVTFINGFTDSTETALAKIRQADALYFTGGVPDRMMQRIGALGLTDAVRAFGGVVLGCSAGAMIQLAEYHVSPDKDYPTFAYYGGLGRLNGFYYEPHYGEWETQQDAIRRVLTERRAPVYATREGKGALIIEDGRVKPVGEVDVFEP